MVPIRAHIVRSSDYICSSCVRRQILLRAAPYNILSQRCSITRNYLAKTAQAADWWCRQADEIRAGKKQSILTTLEQRGYVNSVVGNRDDLDRLITSKRIGAYVGIDPTAPSLHVGHLLPLMALFWMYISGIHTVSLIGGATARVGDPTGRTTSREELTSSVRKANMANMHMQLKGMWANVEQHVRKYNYNWEWAWHRELANNNAWLNKLEIAELLRVLGSGFRVGKMLGKDIVRKRMSSGDGMSLGEFLYPVLQSWDWWNMYHTKGIQVQIGGSDQYGNILSGIEAINYITKTHYDPLIRQEKEEFLNTPMGFTVPLLTAGSGEKFGKSSGNAIWLDKDMTNVFDQYQFFLRTSDEDVGRYLRLFTFMPIQDIEALLETHSAEPPKRVAQHKLAHEVISAIHGEKLATQALTQHGVLFPRSKAAKSVEGTVSVNTGVIPLLNPVAPHTTASNMLLAHLLLPKSLVYNQPISRLLHSAGLVESPGQGHQLAVKQAAYIGSRPGNSGTMGDQLEYTPLKNWDPKHTQKYIIDGDLLILRVGKWKVKIIKVISDEEYERKGLNAPGWKQERESLRFGNRLVQWESKSPPKTGADILGKKAS